MIVGTAVGAVLGAILCGVCGGLTGLLIGTPLMFSSAVGGAIVCGAMGFLTGMIRGGDLVYDVDAWSYAIVLIAGSLVIAAIQDISFRVWIALAVFLAVATGVWLL